METRRGSEQEGVQIRKAVGGGEEWALVKKKSDGCKKNGGKLKHLAW